jgi:exonuclease SbcD
MKFIHCADIHLDSPLKGLELYEGAPEERIRGATRRALERLCDLALDEQVDFVLIAGDLYDGDWKDYNTGLYFTRQMQRLEESGIRVFVVAGNHDAASQLTKMLRPPPNVTVFATAHPQTREMPELGVAIHGQGFATSAVTENLAAGFPARRSAMFNIGLLHTSLDGRPGHANYAPCGLDTLRATGYDYWALGHVHTREIVSESPFVVFPGNLQGRHARETGTKGCTLVTVDDLSVRTVEHRDVTDLRWECTVADLTGTEHMHEVHTRIEEALAAARGAADNRLLAVRLRLCGASKLDARLRAQREQLANEVRASAVQLGGESIWVEKLLIETRPAVDEVAALERDDALGGLLRAIRDLAPDDAGLAALSVEFADFALKLPKDIRDADDGLDPTSPHVLSVALADVKALLMDELLARRSAV